MRLALPLLLVPFCTPAIADDWSDALHAEFEQDDAKAAIKLYRKVAKAKGPRAADARLRRIDLLAKEGKTTALKGAITAFLQNHPKHKQAKKIQLVQKDPAAYVKTIQARGTPKSKNAKVRRILKTRSVTLNFPDTPVTEVVSFLTDITGVGAVVLPDVPQDASVSLRLKNKPLEDAMLEIVKSGKVAYDVICGVIVIGKKNPAAAVTTRFTKKQIAANPDVYLKLKSQQLSINFDGTPITEAMAFIRDISGLSVSVDPALKNATVSARLMSTRLDDTLTILAATAGGKVELSANGLTIKKRK